MIGFLNGTVMRHVLNMRAFTVKFFSCCCAVGAGLPVGPEGPMIHMGLVFILLFNLEMFYTFFNICSLNSI